MNRRRIVGVAALVLAALCWLAEVSFYGGVDPDGVLQESFFLPLTFILGFVGVVMLAASLFRWPRG